VSTEFVEAARKLSTAVVQKYGDGVSISHFEKAVGEIPALTDAQRDLIDIDHTLFTLLEDYLDKKRARDVEREGFRSLVDVSTIEASLAKAKASMGHGPLVSPGSP
jgi:hypothetical protein